MTKGAGRSFGGLQITCGCLDGSPQARLGHRKHDYRGSAVLSVRNRLQGHRNHPQSRFTEGQIAAVLKKYLTSGKLFEVCRRRGIHPDAVRNWKG